MLRLAIDQGTSGRVRPFRAWVCVVAVALGVALVGPAAAAAGSLPAPVLGKSVDVAPVNGQVFVALPGARSSRLTRPRRIPVGSVLDLSRGWARVTSAAGRGSGTHSGEFNGAAARVLQNPSQGGVTELRLTGESFADCGKASAAKLRKPKRIRGVVSARRGRATAALADTGGVGVFRTSGRFAHGENIGPAAWDTVDECGDTQVVATRATVKAETRDGTLPQTLDPGKSVAARCSTAGAPVSARYCIELFSEDTISVVHGREVRDVEYTTAVATGSPDDSYTLCVTAPTGHTTCTPYALGNPFPEGFRVGAVALCTPDQGAGDYLIGWRLRGVRLGAPITYRARARGDATTPCISYLGYFNPDNPGRFSDGFPADVKRVNRYSLPTASTLVFVNVYLAPTGTPGQQEITGVVYSDAGGVPGTLLGRTGALTFTSTDRPDWYSVLFSTPLTLRAGSYWIGIITGAKSNVASFRYETIPGRGVYNANSYSAGPTDPFGPITTDSRQMALWSLYVVAEHFTGSTSQRYAVSFYDDRGSLTNVRSVTDITTKINDTCPGGQTLIVSLSSSLRYQLSQRGTADFTGGIQGQPTYYHIQVAGNVASGSIRDTTISRSGAVCHGYATFTATAH